MFDRGLRFIIGIFLILVVFALIIALFGNVQAKEKPNVVISNISDNMTSNVTEIRATRYTTFEDRVAVDVSGIAAIIILVTIIEVGGICRGEGQLTSEEIWSDDDEE
jgi:hypothetical protein